MYKEANMLGMIIITLSEKRIKSILKCIGIVKHWFSKRICSIKAVFKKDNVNKLNQHTFRISHLTPNYRKCKFSAFYFCNSQRSRHNIMHIPHPLPKGKNTLYVI